VGGLAHKITMARIDMIQRSIEQHLRRIMPETMLGSQLWFDGKTLTDEDIRIFVMMLGKQLEACRDAQRMATDTFPHGAHLGKTLTYLCKRVSLMHLALYERFIRISAAAR
jgi:hypothetical protein